MPTQQKIIVLVYTVQSNAYLCEICVRALVLCALTQAMFCPHANVDLSGCFIMSCCSWTSEITLLKRLLLQPVYGDFGLVYVPHFCYNNYIFYVTSVPSNFLIKIFYIDGCLKDASFVCHGLLYFHVTIVLWGQKHKGLSVLQKS